MRKAQTEEQAGSRDIILHLKEKQNIKHVSLLERRCELTEDSEPDLQEVSVSNTFFYPCRFMSERVCGPPAYKRLSMALLTLAMKRLWAEGSQRGESSSHHRDVTPAAHRPAGGWCSIDRLHIQSHGGTPARVSC